MPPRTSRETPGHGTPAPPAGACGDDADDLLAALLIRMWTLASGRSLPRDVPPDQLTKEELISFWADDMSLPAGRHAQPHEPAPARASQSGRAPRRKDRRPSAKGARDRQEHQADPAAAA
jgi:hypothetical protein